MVVAPFFAYRVDPTLKGILYSAVAEWDTATYAAQATLELICRCGRPVLSAGLLYVETAPSTRTNAMQLSMYIYILRVQVREQRCRDSAAYAAWGQ
eukprot:COSAG06_NODE_414_length_16033_cov_67.366717_4_plen_96_part_00